MVVFCKTNHCGLVVVRELIRESRVDSRAQAQGRMTCDFKNYLEHTTTIQIRGSPTQMVSFMQTHSSATTVACST